MLTLKHPIRWMIQMTLSTLISQATMPGFTGATFDAPKVNLSETEGPTADLVGYLPDGKEATIPFTLNEDMSKRGTIQFWVKIDKKRVGGVKPTNIDQHILKIPNLVSFDFACWSAMPTLRAWWHQPGKKPSRAMLELPHFPAGWLHAAYVWDSEKGYSQRYLNGTPLMQNTQGGMTVRPAATHGHLTIGTFAVAGVKLSAEALSDDQIVAGVPETYRGAFDRMLGKAELGSFDADAVKGDLLYQNPMGSADDTKDWRQEGKAIQVHYEDGWMHMTHKAMPLPDGHLVHWCDQDFPADFVAEWEAQVLGDSGLCIIFFAAKGRNGEDLFDPNLQERLAHFPRYIKGDINCYHASYYAGRRGTSNMRKNYGFYLVSNGPIGIPASSKEIHKMQLIKRGGHIILTENGRKILEFVDDGQTYGPIHGAGKIGFRQMTPAHVRYRNFKVFSYNSQEELSAK